MKSNTPAIALAALLVGGVAVAAFQNNNRADDGNAFYTGEDSTGEERGQRAGLEYAQVLDVAPVNESRERYATVIGTRSEEHTSELQSLMRISYAVFCLKKKTRNTLYT